MISRYDFGAPISTDAVIAHVPASTGVMPHFTLSRDGEALSFSISLGRDDLIFGLGEQVRGINKRGYLYRAWNSDDPSAKAWAILKKIADADSWGGFAEHAARVDVQNWPN